MIGEIRPHYGRFPGKSAPEEAGTSARQGFFRGEDMGAEAGMPIGLFNVRHRTRDATQTCRLTVRTFFPVATILKIGGRNQDSTEMMGGETRTNKRDLANLRRDS